MSNREHWTESADRVSGDGRLIGEDESGFLLVPSKSRPGIWDRTLDLRYPTHWPYYLRSRLTNRIVFLTAVEG